MPYINVKTNRSLNAEQAAAIKTALGQAITAIPGKSEQWLMVGMEDGGKLWFQGSDAPAAMVQVSLFGNASASALDQLTGRITGILTDQTDIPANRIYVSYHPTDSWGWNGGNF